MDHFTLASLPTVWSFIFVEDFLRYFLSAGLLAWLISRFSNWSASNKIQVASATRHDKHREIKHSLSTIVVFSFIGLSIFLLNQWGIGKLQLTPVSGTELLWQSLILIIAHDAYFYWMHRALHSHRFLRRTHGLHHKSSTPSVWAAYSFSIGEALLEAVYLPIMIILVALHPIAVFVFTSHMILRNVMGHAGVELFPSWWLSNPLTRWITTTTHHDMHHSEYSHNYGLYFRWWDWLMGTEHPDYEKRFTKIKSGQRTLQPQPQAQTHVKPQPQALSVTAVSIATLLSGWLLLSDSADASESRKALTGIWLPEHATYAVNLSGCGSRLCAELSNEGLTPGMLTEASKDVNNERRRMRDRALLDLQIGALKRSGGKGLYKGTLYFPEFGALRTTKLKRLDNGSLKIRACQSHRCKSIYWWRPNSPRE